MLGSSDRQVGGRKDEQMKKALLGAAVAAALFMGTAGVAGAGEITGSGKGGPNGDGTPGAVVGAFTPDGHARSICAFSGLEDGSEGGEAGPGNTQNWGQIPRQFRPPTDSPEHPGNACNGRTGFMAGGGGE
jgi:hypothetical protein